MSIVCVEIYCRYYIVLCAICHYLKFPALVTIQKKSLEGGKSIMPYSDAQKRATAKYNAKAYDRIEVKVAKGKKAEIKAYAESKGESVNGFINRVIDEAMSAKR